MTTIRIYDWPYEMWFFSVDIGYRHASVAGAAGFSGRPQGTTLALPRRKVMETTGSSEHPGVVEAVRYALVPNNFVRLIDPNWLIGRSLAVQRLAVGGVRWADGAQWASGATWGPHSVLSQGYSEGDTSVTLTNMPKGHQIFRHGDDIGIDGVHYKVAKPAFANAAGVVTIKLIRGLQADVTTAAQIEYPVSHLFNAAIGIPEDQVPVQSYDWSATMVEVFRPEFDGVTFEDASFFE